MSNTTPTPGDRNDRDHVPPTEKDDVPSPDALRPSSEVELRTDQDADGTTAQIGQIVDPEIAYSPELGKNLYVRAIQIAGRGRGILESCGKNSLHQNVTAAIPRYNEDIEQREIREEPGQVSVIDRAQKEGDERFSIGLNGYEHGVLQVMKDQTVIMTTSDHYGDERIVIKPNGAVENQGYHHGQLPNPQEVERLLDDVDDALSQLEN